MKTRVNSPARIWLDHVPKPDEVPDLAARLRRNWGLGPDIRLDVEQACANLGIDFEERSLRGCWGGAQGLLLPNRHGFTIEVDPEPRGGWASVVPPLRSSLRRHRSRFLACHELAHTLFYRPGSAGPERLVFDSSRQEAFCDELARSLLIPPAVAREQFFGPATIVKLQRRFDVSMELAVRSAVAAHAGRRVAWLLLRRGEKTLVQWTSADQGHTARALKSLRGLVERAACSASGSAQSAGAAFKADALFLHSRGQAIVTSA